MKKTIIASAIAAVVAAPAAFADLKISGQANMEMNDTQGSDLYMDFNSDIVFSGSEDLGNGLKASFKIATSPDHETAGASLGEDDRYIQLSGDFGTVTFGRYEQLVSAKGTDMANSLASSEVITVEEKPTGTGLRGTQGIRYTSPNFNGVTVEVGTFLDGVDSDTATSDDFDQTEFMVQYSNAGLTVRYISDNPAAANQDTSVIGATYKMGDLTVGITDVNTDIAGKDATIVGAQYTMGANTFGAAYVASHGTTATEGDYILKATHALSKSTNVWVGFDNDDNGADKTVVGVQHKF
jgi:predicted porin